MYGCGDLLVCMSVHYMCACCAWSPEGSMGSPGTKVTAGCELPVGAGNRPNSSGKAACVLLLLFFKIEFFRSFCACPGTSSCRPGWPQTHRDPLASASRVPGLKMGVRHHCLVPHQGLKVK